VSLNVKDPEAHRLAEAIARETGDSLTKVVIDSLRERHEKLEKRRSKASLAELMTIARRASRAVKRPYVDHAELLYDDNACRSDSRYFSAGGYSF
jgi:antitoxin VapB